MASAWRVLVMLLMPLSLVNARPEMPSETIEPVAHDEEAVAAAQTPRVYLIVAESLLDSEHDGPSLEDDRLEKRSAEEVDDLEAAAGTNVLRPLFVYRQQLAYRDRVKKGAFNKRFGIRPRF